MRRARAEPELQVHRRVGVVHLDAIVDGVVVPFLPPGPEHAGGHRGNVDEDADALQRIRDEGGGARRRRHVVADEQREAYGAASRVVQHAVAGAIAKTQLGEHRARQLRIGAAERQIGIEPRCVGGSHRVGNRIAGAVKDLLAVLAAIDRGGHGQPEFFVRHPGFVRLRVFRGFVRLRAFGASARCARSIPRGREPEGVGVEAGAEIEQARLSALLDLLQRLELFRKNRQLAEIVLAGTAAREHDFIQARQRQSVRRFVPVVRVRHERTVAFFDKRPEAGERHAIEHAQTRRERLQKLDFERQRIDRPKRERMARSLHRGQRGESQLGGQRRPVGRGDALAKLERVGEVVGRGCPRPCQPRLDAVGPAVHAHQRRTGQALDRERGRAGRSRQRATSRQAGFDERFGAGLFHCSLRFGSALALQTKGFGGDPPNREDRHANHGGDAERGIHAAGRAGGPSQISPHWPMGWPPRRAWRRLQICTQNCRRTSREVAFPTAGRGFLVPYQNRPMD